ncbi:MAG: hypothetical protein ACI9K2_001502 [Myxococcota bacterium]|jgi:hypothetical protein
MSIECRPRGRARGGVAGPPTRRPRRTRPVYIPQFVGRRPTAKRTGRWLHDGDALGREQQAREHVCPVRCLREGAAWACEDGSEAALRSSSFRDSDGDGVGDSSSPTSTCDLPDGYSLVGGDCDDRVPEVDPGAPERCNGIDDNCDGLIDDADPDGVMDGPTRFADTDDDGLGDPDAPRAGRRNRRVRTTRALGPWTPLSGHRGKPGATEPNRGRRRSDAELPREAVNTLGCRTPRT